MAVSSKKEEKQTTRGILSIAFAIPSESASAYTGLAPLTSSSFTGESWLALMLAGSRLGFRTSRLDLLNPKSSYNQLWLEYIDEFGDADDVVVVV